MSAPGFLLADEANHHLIEYMLEALNNTVQFQFTSKVVEYHYACHKPLTSFLNRQPSFNFCYTEKSSKVSKTSRIQS